MTTQAMIDLELSAQAPAKATPRRGYVRPTVRPLAIATAHPSNECWPRAGREQQSVAPIGTAETPARRHSPLRLVTGAKVARKTGGGAAADVASRFDALQRRMRAVEASTRAGRPYRLVIVPSRTIDKWHESPAGTQAFEERLLCALLGLRDPGLHITYVTSSPIAPGIIDYYLSLLPRRIRKHARSRLTLVALGERTARPLSQTLLERPLAVERIRRTISDADACCLVPYNTTTLEREVAVALGIGMYGADPDLAYLGTKSGCRELFGRAGVPHPAGCEGITSVTAAVDAIAQLRRVKPELSLAVLKLNAGVSGEGNALIDLEMLPEPGAPDEADLIARRVQAVAPGSGGDPPRLPGKARRCRRDRGGVDRRSRDPQPQRAATDHPFR